MTNETETTPPTGDASTPKGLGQRIQLVLNNATEAVSSQWPRTWKQAIPNILTLFRLGAGPLVFLGLWSKSPAVAWVVLVLFVLAAMTDYLDGFLSRLWKTESWLGKVLDPVADKILVASVLIGLIAFQPANFWVSIIVYIMLMRELLVSGLRQANANDQALAVSILGKAKTLFQMVALVVLLVENAIGISLNTGYWILAFGMLLGVISMGQYLVALLRSPPATGD